jgi:hypothetical protein
MYQPVIDILKSENRFDLRSEIPSLQFRTEQINGDTRMENFRIDKLVDELKIDFRK